MGSSMLRKLLVVSTAFAALVAFTVVSQPSAAGDCAALSESAIGLKQADAADRARRQLKRKINRWAEKNGYKNVRTVKSSSMCTQKGAIANCTASAKVCG